MASRNGQKVVVKLPLAKNDVDQDSKDIDNKTPLLRAVANGHEEVVGLQLAKNVINSGSGNTNNQSPLPQAAENGNHEVVLVEDGVDPDSRDK